MNNEKYIGLDVHQATIVVAVMDSTGKLVMESILETEAATMKMPIKLQLVVAIRKVVRIVNITTAVRNGGGYGSLVREFAFPRRLHSTCPLTTFSMKRGV